MKRHLICKAETEIHVIVINKTLINSKMCYSGSVVIGSFFPGRNVKRAKKEIC